GRYLPEYQKIRKENSFHEVCKTPELAAEVTAQPVDILGVDAAIIFSDILVVPDAMGWPYKMVKGEGPVFEKTFEGEKDLKNIKSNHLEKLSYVSKAIQLTKEKLNGKVPIIGFAGAPWTIYCYMVEGKGSKTFSKARRFLYTMPDVAHALLNEITSMTIEYLKLQIKNGAEIVQVFDSWAGILNKEQYKEFGLKYINDICNAIEEVPVIVFSKGAYECRKELGELNCEVISLDWNMDIKESIDLVGKNKTYQGNLDPCALYADKNRIESETKKMIVRFKDVNYIANLGHGVYPDTSPENVKFFIDTVKAYK
ncbi:MAG: uroporphyrinogen decarboxylase, partial [Flavobacteriales bacterium]